jgi:hypothetical protein
VDLQLDAEVSEKHTASICIADFSPENEESVFFRKVVLYLQIHTAWQPKRHLHRRENLISHRQGIYKDAEAMLFEEPQLKNANDDTVIRLGSFNAS